MAARQDLRHQDVQTVHILEPAASGQYHQHLAAVLL